MQVGLFARPCLLLLCVVSDDATPALFPQKQYEDIELTEDDYAKTQMDYTDPDFHENGIWEVAKLEDEKALDNLPTFEEVRTGGEGESKACSVS